MLPLSKAIGAAILVFAASVHAAPFTKDTAPDAISRDILSHPLTRIHEGAPHGVDPSPTIHRNFPKLVEQNLARLDAGQLANLIDNLSEAELSDLAQLYINSTSDNGLPPKLLYMIANRLDGDRLGRLSRHFGFAEMYAAVTAMVPAKTQDFLASTYTSYSGPTPGEMRFGPNGRFAAPTGTRLMSSNYIAPVELSRGYMRKVGFGQFMNHTPYEIYLSFRTAPVGALAATGALWETSVVLSSTLTAAYGTGYAIGTYVVGPLIQAYAPSLYERLGSTIGSIVNTLTNSWSGGASTAGQAQKSTAPIFQSTNQQIGDFSGFGGDYGAAEAWSSTGGGGTCHSGCPPLHAY